MKRYFKILAGLGLVLFLVGCTSRKDINKYVEVTFSGINSEGNAQYDVDTEKMVKDILGYDTETKVPTDKELEEITDMLDSYKIKLSKTDKLSNGDKVKVTITVNEEKTKKLKSSEKTVEVKGLEEPKKLTNKDVEKNLVVNFTGASGRGIAKIDNMFDSPLDSIKFEFENEGELKNGDKAKIILSKEQKESLILDGYIPEKDFAPTFEVSGLEEVAEKASDIKNIEDIKRMIDEQVKRKYKDLSPDSSFGIRYEITLNKMMYRQFDKEDSKDDTFYSSYSNTGQNGNLIGIYTIKEYSGGTESKLKDTLTAIIGYSNIILDKDKNANVADLTEINTTKDDTYSLESVLKLYEGYGYTTVE